MHAVTVPVPGPLDRRQALVGTAYAALFETDKVAVAVINEPVLVVPMAYRGRALRSRLAETAVARPFWSMVAMEYRSRTRLRCWSCSGWWFRPADCRVR